MKTIIILLVATLSSQYCLAEGFDFYGDVHCASNVGGYDDIEKFSVMASDSEGVRDLVIHSWGSEVFEAACSQSNSSISCSWKGAFRHYSLDIDLSTVRADVDMDGTLNGYVVDGKIKRTFSGKHGVSCFQYL